MARWGNVLLLQKVLHCQGMSFVPLSSSHPLPPCPPCSLSSFRLAGLSLCWQCRAEWFLSLALPPPPPTPALQA